jgi:large subunit ribosomal protein L21
MFAVFEDGARQYRVQAGDRLNVDFRDTANQGDTLTFDRVLAAGTEDSAGTIGRPFIDGAKITAEVVDPEFKARKIEGGKFKRRKSYIRHWGHTQRHTTVVIKTIEVPGA